MLDPSRSKEKKVESLLNLSPDALNVLAKPGALHGWFIGSTDATAVYVKFYNKLAADVNPAEDVPVIRLLIPGTAGGTGAGANFFTEFAIRQFDVAISVRATTGVEDTDTGDPGDNVVTGNFAYTDNSYL